MRITCPHCGARDAQEFSYLGAADLARPDGMAASEAAMVDYVYLRDNPRGRHRELWYHGAGCRAWLVVGRDTFTHAVISVEPAKRHAGGAA
ncbi:sarcosine oxidase subunit delta [Bosea sp. (in: a-proteobacteria)]|uniref:sarcosine oxidase subunit delta n=1 Tax=Bosea sp. (in: a-proteobacteria) TaxID=1871050 RepID=UPI00261B552F|nr:sarcosine oxidase subunit delta [Bosea sp. (in: a-proteobacteria)]MCO5093173.1 sarcosine oxidase subunit delta [Bosea sp. (in: a-proteobacteria)]